jgi:probable F420-dependent oxidoreductase
MKLGVAYPTTEVAGDPDAVRKFVRAAEELGFAHMMTFDHVLKTPHEGRVPELTGPYTDKDTFYDPFTLFAFSAAVSDTLEFVTGVLVGPQRQTVLLAQQAADVDLLSRERLRLGVGIGWNYVEYEALGQDFKTRAKRLEEQFDLLRQLWTKPLVDFTGRFDRVDRGCINPRPRRQIPLWVGGNSEPAYERGARIGDGLEPGAASFARTWA